MTWALRFRTAVNAVGLRAEETPELNRDWLEALYQRYNRREFVASDPVLFLHRYPVLRDREVVGLVASSLAYGRVAQIVRSVDAVLSRMGISPFAFVMSSSARAVTRAFRSFRHRFTSGVEVAALVIGARRVLARHGSLETCFGNHLGRSGGSLVPALSGFARELGSAEGTVDSLLPRPERGSACKRLNLFLRWMVRNDEVDPGGWSCVSPASLLVPLDTHMHRVGLELGATRRRQADMRTAQDVTAAFREVSPDDPVRYDFALTRLATLGPGYPAGACISHRLSSRGVAEGGECEACDQGHRRRIQGDTSRRPTERNEAGAVVSGGAAESR
jgi:uncharacterized protein (TIGR02757 family)